MQKSRRGCIISIVGVAILIVLLVWVVPAINRYGFCRNWWLHDTLWAHFYWQCTCGPEFEQSLFQDDVEIVVSACRSPQEVSMSTNGQYMIVTLLEDDQNISYVTELTTGQERPWPYINFTSQSTLDGFWTENLFLLSLGTQGTIKLIDVTDLTELSLTVSTAPTLETSFELEIPEEMLQAMKESNRVIVHRTEPAILILADDPKRPSAKNYLLQYQNHPLLKENMNELLTENEIAFQTLTRGGSNIESFYTLISYNGLFYDSTGGIYTSGGKKVTEIGEVTGPGYQPITIGWAPDNSGVYYHLLYDYGWLAGGGLLSKNLVPGPIIKLNVPQAYR